MRLPESDEDTQSLPRSLQQRPEAAALYRAFTNEVKRVHIIRFIASGGGGSVFESWDYELNRNVVVKIVDTHDRGNKKRFEREARLGQQLDERYVARVFRWADLKKRPSLSYMVQELLSGVSLAQKIIDGDDLPPLIRLRYLKELADALTYIHEKNVVHRDLSPKNVQILHDHRVKLLDFGQAKELEDTRGSVTWTRVAGTPGWRAPEVEQDAYSADRRADVFTFGQMALHLLHGRLDKSCEVDPDLKGKSLSATPFKELEVILTGCVRDDASLRPLLPQIRGALLSLEGKLIPNSIDTPSLVTVPIASPRSTLPLPAQPLPAPVPPAPVPPAPVPPPVPYSIFPMPNKLVAAMGGMMLLGVILSPWLIGSKAGAPDFNAGNSQPNPSVLEQVLPPLQTEIRKTATGAAIFFRVERPTGINSHYCALERTPKWSTKWPSKSVSCEGEIIEVSDEVELEAGVTYSYKLHLLDQEQKGQDLALWASAPIRISK